MDQLKYVTYEQNLTLNTLAHAHPISRAKTNTVHREIWVAIKFGKMA